MMIINRLMGPAAALSPSPRSTPMKGARGPCRRAGFTLIELLVVITIILIVSAVALPTVLPALSHRQVSEAARILQAALVGARDSAIRTNSPNGIRLLPDPTFSGMNSSNVIDPTLPLASNRIIPIAAAPDYSEGLVSIYSTSGANATNYSAIQTFNPTGNNSFTTTNCLVIEESPVNSNFLPNSPTSWFWNIRIGDKIQINHAGPWYTVVGPMVNGPSQGNSELFVNDNLPGIKSLWSRTFGSSTTPLSPEYLLLVDGQDDNNNGWVDEGFDGVDNNGNTLVDEFAEWLETEVWHGAIAKQLVTSSTGALLSLPYVIQRRPAPTINAREVMLPTNVVVDLTTWGYPSTNPSLERSRLPVNPFTGYVDVMVNANGSVVLSLLYSTPAAAGLSSSFLHFWLAERSDVYAPTNNSVSTAAPYLPPFLPLPQGTAPGAFSGAEIKGEYRLVTLFTRNGQVTTNETVPFDPSAATDFGTATYNTSYPFIQAQQGVRGGQ
jgi:prepilin-type N-terminal cleavage/methylation domain-containing protein